ncbi:hypothetical protein D3C78_1490030 [compost metagenome]
MRDGGADYHTQQTAAGVVVIFVAGCRGATGPKLLAVAQIDQPGFYGDARFAVNHYIAGAILRDVQIQYCVSAEDLMQLLDADGADVIGIGQTVLLECFLNHGDRQHIVASFSQR